MNHGLFSGRQVAHDSLGMLQVPRLMRRIRYGVFPVRVFDLVHRFNRLQYPDHRALAKTALLCISIFLAT